MTNNKINYCTLKFILIASFLSFELVAQTTPKEQDLELVVGIDKVERLNFRPSTKVEVGNESVLTYTIIPDDHIREITFRGLKPGKTSIIIRNTTGEIKARYKVNITSNDLSRTVIKLRDFFDEIEGIKVGIKGGSVVVEGEIVVPSDIGKVKVILSREEYKDVLALVELSPQTQVIVSNRMQDEIQKNGIKDVTVRVVNKQYWLEGFVTRKGDIQTAIDIAKGLLPDKLENLSVTTGAVSTVQRDDIVSFITENIKTPPSPLPKLIKITSQFVEMAKDYTKSFGLKWTPALAGTGGQVQFGKTIDGGVTTRSSGTLSGTISNLFPKLASAKSAGNARIIQQGMVVVKEGVQAQINKTTKTPFALGTGDFTRSQEAESGLKVSITPTVATDNNIELNASIGFNITSGSPPQTISNSVSTTVLVKSSESAAIGGITVNESSTQYDKDPPYGADQFENATPLFSFLKSKSFVTNKSQFVVFITPELIDSASRDTDRIRQKFRRKRRR